MTGSQKIFTLLAGLAVLKFISKPKKQESADKVLKGMIAPVYGKITGRFGDPRGGRNHNGIDIAVPIDTPVAAPLDGKVLNFYVNKEGGLQMLLSHAGGITSGFAHLNRLGPFKIGDKVKRGQTVVYSGNSGIGTGPHVHFTLRKGNEYIDPEFLFQKV